MDEAMNVLAVMGRSLFGFIDFRNVCMTLVSPSPRERRLILHLPCSKVKQVDLLLLSLVAMIAVVVACTTARCDNCLCYERLAAQLNS